MKTYSTKEVFDHIKKKIAANPPKMVYEVDYKRLEKAREADRKRNEVIQDCLILELNGVKDALNFVEWQNKDLRMRIRKLEQKRPSRTKATKPK